MLDCVQNGCTIFHSHWQYRSVLISSPPCKGLFSELFIIWIVPRGCKVVALICISLMTDVQHLAVCLLAICVSSLENSSDPSPIFNLDYFSFYCWVMQILYIYILHPSPKSYDLERFSFILWWFFSWWYPLKLVCVYQLHIMKFVK